MAAPADHVSWLRKMAEEAPKEVEALFFERTLAAEASRERETRAAIRAQAVWRGLSIRTLVAYWDQHALLVERVTRGYLGRQRSMRIQIERDTVRQRAFFDAFATTIQLRFRGFHSRKYVHNFYARKAYVAAVVHKGDAVRKQLQQRLEGQVNERTNQEESQGRETVTRLASRLHHLRSTASCTGIYNSPYHVGYHPTAFGIAVEEHLRTAIRPLIKQELKGRAKSLKPLQSLPPIKPLHSPISYEAVQQDARQERWLSKTKRIAQEDFVTAAGRLPFRYPGSVHTGTGYNPPGNLPREVDKTKWVSQRTFVGAVPSNRLISADDYGQTAEPRDQARMTMSMNAVSR